MVSNYPNMPNDVNKKGVVGHFMGSDIHVRRIEFQPKIKIKMMYRSKSGSIVVPYPLGNLAVFNNMSRSFNLSAAERAHGIDSEASRCEQGISGDGIPKEFPQKKDFLT